MNSAERLRARMAAKEVDRLPNSCLVMAFAARQIGVEYREYVTDYRLLVKGVTLCHERFGIDMYCVISDPMREAEGLGAEVVFPPDGVPHSPVKLLKSSADIGKLQLAEPSKCRRMNDRLEAVHALAQQSGGRVPVVGWVEGAVAESCDLMEMSEFLMSLLDEPEEIRALLELCTRQAILFAQEQIRAGADIVGVGDAAASLLGPALYEEFALPYQQRLIAAIHEAGALAKLHICGNLNPVLELVAKTGADIIDLDHMVELGRAAELFGPGISIAGNFDPVSVLLQGTPELVRAAVKSCAETAGKNSIVAAGCEVPPHTPPENLLAVAEACREAAPG